LAQDAQLLFGGQRLWSGSLAGQDAAFDRFVVGSMDGLVAAFTPAGEEVFRVQLRSQELALRLTLRDGPGVVALVKKNASPVQFRLATFDASGAEVASTAIDPVLDAAATRGGEMFAVIRLGSNELSLISSDDGRTLRSINL
jgi:hypothetical protein